MTHRQHFPFRHWDQVDQINRDLAIVKLEDDLYSQTFLNPDGVPVETLEQDNTSPMLLLYFTKERAQLTLFEDTVIDLNDIKVPTPSGVLPKGTVDPLGEDYIGIFSGTGQFYFGTPIAVIVDDGGQGYDLITLDAPIDFVYTTALSVVLRSTRNFAKANGAIGAPDTYSIQSGANQKIDITRMMMSGLASTSMDDGKFLSIPALPNGQVLRSSNGVKNNIITLNRGIDFRTVAHNYDYIDKAPAGQFGVGWRWTLKELGIVQRIIPGESLDWLCQDVYDGTSLIDVHFMAEGHIVVD